MFAFLIWDKQEKVLFGARDQFEIKPFFYMENLDRTYFSSEKKSILLAIKNDIINDESLQHLINYRFWYQPDKECNLGTEKYQNFLVTKLGCFLKMLNYSIEQLVFMIKVRFLQF